MLESKWLWSQDYTDESSSYESDSSDEEEKIEEK